MKLITIVSTLFVAFNATAIPRPMSVPSRLVEVKATTWYVEITNSWKDYLSENPEDQGGWLEYFKAARYAELPREELVEIAQSIQSRYPDSFEAHYAKSRVNPWSDESIIHLKQALELRDDRSLLPDKLLLEEYHLNENSRSAFAQEVYQSNYLFPSLLNYSYNVLMSVEEDGILFTQGENTTVPLYVLQDAMGIRQDVKILNIELIQNENYRKRKLESLNLTLNIKPGDNISVELPLSNPSNKFYYALTLPRLDLEQIEDRLYVVGLTSQLSDEEIDNYSVLKQNIERNFLLDYLSVDFNGEPKTATGRVFEANYTVPFLLLKEYYDQIGDLNQSAFWREKLIEVAERTQRKDRVESLLGISKIETAPNFRAIKLDIKSLDKSILKVKDNIYAGKYEVTNRDYEFFLKYLNDNGYSDLYQQASFDLTKYDGIAFSLIKDYHFNPRKTVKTSATTYSKYPAMDMSYEAAKLYCEWLTAQYNVQQGRKFNKVEFRLPSEKEWTMAALGYPDFQSWNFAENVVRARPNDQAKRGQYQEFKLVKGDVSYPWYFDDWQNMRNSIVNKHKCHLANVKTADEVTCPAGVVGDGFTVTSPVGFYFSNKMGLYDAIGNVAEMIDERGKAMGGSWNHTAEESTVTSINLYEGSDPAVGFRLFMEVIEE